MAHVLQQPMLSLSTQTFDQIHQVDIDDLTVMWNVFSKCKDHLKSGRRLENMAWRLWHHERQQVCRQQHTQTPANVEYRSSLPPHHSTILSSSTELSSPSSSSSCTPHARSSLKSQSASSTTSTCASSIKRFISSLSPEYNQNPNSTATIVPHDPTNNVSTGIIQTYKDDSSEFHDRQICQQQQQQHPRFTSYIQDHLVDDDFEEEDDDFDEDDDDNDVFMLDDRFTKTEPPRRNGQLSLLTAMLQQKKQQYHTTTTIASSLALASPSKVATAHEHYLCKELSESLKRNVLWEHIQQKPVCVNFSNQHRQKQARILQQGVARSGNDLECSQRQTTAGWLESFHGW
ncbi:hypothetical protein BX666DRAFT_1940686 [Dichotomocladium elegans]|nr:hypothetical protein BX666DRAFT_1940686 [Dichotomocladium elegans]